MDNELRTYLDSQFKQVNSRMDAFGEKLDGTNELTIRNSEMISYAREEIENAKATQGQCAKHCEGHRTGLRTFVIDKATSISKEGDLQLKVWLLTVTVGLMFSLFHKYITGAFSK